MDNACLTPFYEYVLKKWISTNKKLPEFDIVFGSNVMEESEISTWYAQIEKRKRYIWDQTAKVCAFKDDSKVISYISELKRKSCKCNLCSYCIGCETDYWEEVLQCVVNSVDPFEYKSKYLIPEYVNKLLEQKQKPVDIYLDRALRRRTSEQNCLIMLKGLSSSTPILLNYGDHSEKMSGGGFYIRWNGKGIAVDPGYMFVQNLHDAGFTVLDVDAVIVTHEHIDHSFDIRLLDDLHSNVANSNRNVESKWNSEWHDVSKLEKEPHKIHWYLDSVTYSMTRVYSERKSGFSDKTNCINSICVDRDSSINLFNDITMKIFPTDHEQYEENGKSLFYNHTFGCILECHSLKSDVSIGYTSDTSIVRDKTYCCMMEKLKYCDMVIANISGIYKDDILLQNMKQRHLGYNGCFKILSELVRKADSKIKLFVLSEFSNIVTDIRFDISKYLQAEIERVLKTEKKSFPLVVPGENGMKVSLDTLGIQCTACQKFSNSISVLKPLGENQKLGYICKDCMY